MKVADKTYQRGLDAMGEVKYRRSGLLLSLVAIAFVILALALLLIEIERKDRNKKEIV
jgi:hypothetical protein